MKEISLINVLRIPATIYEYTSFIHDYDDLTTSIDIDRQPSREAALKFKISPLVGGVTITVNGSLNGTSKNETFHLSSAGYKVSSNTYDSITSIAATGFTSGKISVEAVEESGEPIKWWSEVDEIRVRLSRRRISIGVETQGSVETTGMSIYSLDDVDEDNVFYVAGVTYTIKAKYPRYSGFAKDPSYYQYDVEQVEGT